MNPDKKKKKPTLQEVARKRMSFDPKGTILKGGAGAASKKKG